MAFFGKNEAELKQIAGDLDKQATELENRDSSLKAMQSNLEHERKLLEGTKAQFENDRNTFETEKEEFEKRRSEVLKREAEAKTGFVEHQREAFKEVIEKRIVELDARQQELNGLEEQLSLKLNNLHATEGEIAKRELAVTEREQKADSGFADKVKALADEAARQYKANQEEAERLRKRADAVSEERNSLEVAKAKLVQREQSIIAAEQRRDTGFADERAALDIELQSQRAEMESKLEDVRERKLSTLDDEITKLKTKRLEEVSQTEQAERDRIRDKIAVERDAWENQQKDALKKLETERTELDTQKGALSAVRSELAGRMTELEANERVLERKEMRLEQKWQKRNDDLADEVEARIEAERTSLQAEIQSYKEINDRLRKGLCDQTELTGAYDQLKRQLGDKDPAEILRDLNSKTDEFKRLREELATRPTEEMRDRFQQIDSECKRLQAEKDELNRRIAENDSLLSDALEQRRKNSELEAENKTLEKIANLYEGAANEATAELERLRSAYERPAEVEARYKEIEMPHIKSDKVKQPARADIDEIIWLDGISNASENYGLHFNPRIMKAFHTSLKTAEWSPLTVLAGVSGTGKSELPRLYSHFGGLIFEPLSVQPNWDSQESMLGFFNSIDNKFDAQSLLRLLAQSQKKWVDKTNENEGYPGLEDAISLVLLDEMNLAHPELYFAEFLSKLELRRGMKGSDVPFLPVKIGAGLPPYQLPLGRNVLWTGTMNQDETTKSLSDKVLDRSMVIHFPRPTDLKRRLKLTPLDEKNRGPLLHKNSWQSWLAQGSSFSEQEIKPYKSFVESINTSLEVAGRAIGHRVWQSVEYYMANYPDVRAAQKAADPDELAKAMHVAFEDQLVQKVMPKLRGIDTVGRSNTECLKKILGQINTGIRGSSFNLAKDFKLACELGYGQFIWQSAYYLEESPNSGDE
jgi:hypothetical protein